MEMTNDRVICANNAWLHNTVCVPLNVLYFGVYLNLCLISYTQAFHEPIKKMSNQRENNYKK